MGSLNGLGNRDEDQNIEVYGYEEKLKGHSDGQRRLKEYSVEAALRHWKTDRGSYRWRALKR